MQSFRTLDADKDEFFGFLPSFQGSALPGAAPLAFSTPCFGAVRVAASLKNGSVEVAFQAKQRRSAACSDMYLLSTTMSLHLEPVRTLSPHMSHGCPQANWPNCSI